MVRISQRLIYCYVLIKDCLSPKKGEIVKMNGGSDFKWATDVDERNLLWKTRHDILYACMALRPGCKVS